jgi:hypothetical protein
MEDQSWSVDGFRRRTGEVHGGLCSPTAARTPRAGGLLSAAYTAEKGLVCAGAAISIVSAPAADAMHP